MHNLTLNIPVSWKRDKSTRFRFQILIRIKSNHTMVINKPMKNPIKAYRTSTTLHVCNRIRTK
ncbi:hypothetical protein HanRHA438_Chr15g0697241 [Helianthus annuus]|nr:hypothetical protein HanRHA438_Chr15g0697241 [Helianthus annuus]